jgi:hypothetical protein
MRVKLFFALLLWLTARSAFGGACTSNVATNPGNWNAAATWGVGCTGAGGIPATIDTVTIANGDTVQVTASASVASVTMAGGTATNVFLNVNSGVTLSVTGNVTYTASTSNTRTRRITVASTGQLLIGGGLTINTGAVTGSVADVAIAAGAAVSVSGSISYTGTVAPSITVTGTGALTVGGDFINGMTFTPASGGVLTTATARRTSAPIPTTIVIGKSGESPLQQGLSVRQR